MGADGSCDIAERLAEDLSQLQSSPASLWALGQNPRIRARWLARLLTVETLRSACRATST